MSIAFKTTDGFWTDPTANPVPNLDNADYRACKVTGKINNGAVWIVYSLSDYGTDGTPGESKIVYPDQEGTEIPTDFSIKSAQAFNAGFPCICLFEHPNYMGHKLATSKDVADLTKEFPGSWYGVSSAIALSGKWRPYLDTGFQGPHADDINAMNGVNELPSLGNAGDKIKSIKLLEQ